MEVTTLFWGTKMSFTHTIGYTWTNGSGSLSASIAQTQDNESNFDIVANTSAVNSGVTPVVLNFGAPTNVKSMYIVSDNPVSLTITITGGTPATLVLTLVANTPYLWITGNGIASPLGSAGTVTGVSISNASSTINPNVKMRFLISA